MDPLRLSLRRLARRPVFAASAVLLLGGTIAIAVSASSAAYQTLLRPLPYADEDRLVALYWASEELGIPDMSTSLAVARELAARSSAFESVAATQTPMSATLLREGTPAHLTVGLAGPEAFTVLGVTPIFGRGFTEDEGERGTASTAVVLGYAAWQRLRSGDEAALGAPLVINGRERTVVGILPEGRSLAPEQSQSIDVWFPMGVATEFLGNGVFDASGVQSFRVTARLRPTATVAGLPSELARIADGVARDFPERYLGWQLRADPLRARVFGRVEGPATALFLGSLLFSGVAVLNLVGLLYVRTDQDARVMAIRRALGATGAHIRRLRLADAASLGALGGSCGVAFAYAALWLVRRADLLELPPHVRLGFGWGQLTAVLVAALAVTLVASLLVGEARDPASAEGRALPGRGGGRPARSGRMLFALALQVALSTALASAGISALRSLDDLQAMDDGVAADDLWTARVEVPRELAAPADVASDARELVGQLAERPAVRGAFVWSPELPTDAHTFTGLFLESPPPGSEGEILIARYHTVSPGAISGLGLRFVEGRDMTEDDWSSGRRVALVTRSAAERWWGSAGAALGQRIRRTSHPEWSDVIGVLADAPLSGRFGPGSDNALDVFFMFDQDPRSTFHLFVAGERGRIDPDDIGATAARVLPNGPLHDPRWMTDRLRDQESALRSTATFAGAYALASLLLASIGLGGTTLLVLGRRRAEVGVRQALGGSRARVILELLRGSVLAVALGLAAGLVLARLGLRLMDPVVLRVGPDDLVSQLGATVIFGLCAAAAMTLPALVSVRRDPARNLTTATERT